MTEDYWRTFWKEGEITENEDPQNQVGRTKFGKTIEKEVWVDTLQFIKEKLQLNPDHRVLELCAGNGLVTAEIAKHVDSVVAVDYSKKLLDSFVVHDGNVEKIHSDVLSFSIQKESYDRILLYFSAQHFSELEMTKIVSNSWAGLRQDGMLYIGDIPDIEKRWDFYNKKTYRQFLFDKFLKNEHHIGTWFDAKFFLYLGEYTGFRESERIEQPSFMINASHRFDIMYKK